MKKLSNDLQREFLNMNGFSMQNLWRMKQLYETYKDNEKLSPLVRELPWTHNVIILHNTENIEEKEFYIKTCISEKWSRRELERQIESSLYERFMLSKKTNKLVPHTKEKNILEHFKGSSPFCVGKNDQKNIFYEHSTNPATAGFVDARQTEFLEFFCYKQVTPMGFLDMF